MTNVTNQKRKKLSELSDEDFKNLTDQEVLEYISETNDLIKERAKELWGGPLFHGWTINLIPNQEGDFPLCFDFNAMGFKICPECDQEILGKKHTHWISAREMDQRKKKFENNEEVKQFQERIQRETLEAKALGERLLNKDE